MKSNENFANKSFSKVCVNFASLFVPHPAIQEQDVRSVDSFITNQGLLDLLSIISFENAQFLV